MLEGAVLNNGGTFIVDPGNGTAVIRGDGVFNNRGTLRKIGGPGGLGIETKYNNFDHARVEADLGIIYFTDAIGNFGVSSYTGSSNGEVQFVSGSLGGGARINGPGTISGTISIVPNGNSDIYNNIPITITADVNIGSGIVMHGSNWNLKGTTTWAGDGYIQIWSDAIVNNSGTFVLQADNGVSQSVWGAGVINNRGTIRRIGGGGSTVIEPTVNNFDGARIESQAGSILFENAVNNFGIVTYTSVGDAVAGFLSGSLGGGARINGPGTISGTIGIVPNGNSDIYNNVPITITADVNIGSGIVMHGSDWNLKGTTTWTGGGYILIWSDAVVNNSGTFVLQAGNGVDQSIGGDGVINNRGTIRRIGGGGSTVIDPTVNNFDGARIESQAGSLLFEGYVNNFGIVTYTSVGDAVAGFLSGSLGGGARINGPGTISGTIGIVPHVNSEVYSNVPVSITAKVNIGDGISLANGIWNFMGSTDLGPGFSFRLESGVTINNSGIFRLQDNTVLGEDSVFNNSGTFTKTGGSGGSRIEPNFVNTGTVEALSGSLDFVSFTQTGGTTNLNGGDVSTSASLRIMGGRLIGDGTITGDVENSGTVAPGHSAGRLVIQGDYVQKSDGALNLEIGGNVAGTEYDQLKISGAATLSGTLNVSLINGYVPTVNTTFQLVTYGLRVGSFRSVNATNFAPTYQPTGLQLVALQSGGATPTPAPVATGSGDQELPRVDGSIAVWEDNSAGTFDVRARNLDTGQDFIISALATSDQRRPDVSGSLVVWQDNRSGNWDIWGVRISANNQLGAPFQIASGPDQQTSPSVSGNNVVWQTAATTGGRGDVWLRDLSSEGSLPQVQSEQQYTNANPAIDGNTLVWQRAAPGTTSDTGAWDIVGRYLDTGVRFVVNAEPGAQINPDVSANYVVWQDYQPPSSEQPFPRSRWGCRAVGLDDLQNIFDLSTDPTMEQINPRISLRFVVYQTRPLLTADSPRGNDSWRIEEAEVTSGQHGPISNSPLESTNPAIWGRTVAWEQQVNATNSDIYCLRCALGFSDAQISDYFYLPVKFLAGIGAISGYSDGTFRPFNTTTRGQLAKIIVAGEGWAIDTAGGPHFSDVETTNPFYNYIETAFNRGVISGYTDGTFRWGNNVTRGQLSKIVVKAKGWALLNPAQPTFQDVPTSNAFYREIETAVAKGVISGYDITGGKEFRWVNNATRGQISKIVYLALIQR